LFSLVILPLQKPNMLDRALAILSIHNSGDIKERYLPDKNAEIVS